MKGVFFHQGLEWTVETQGEEWQQGQPLTGTLSVKNHGTTEAALEGAGIALAHGDLKKVHAKDEKALKLKNSISFTDKKVAAGATNSVRFEFALDDNCPVSDKKSSCFLSYGPSMGPGHLQLKIIPAALFTEITKLLETFQRFKLKDIKASKGVEFKLIPPTSREMAHVEGVSFHPKKNADELVLDFVFQTKGLDLNSVTTKVAKEVKNVARTIGPKDYSLGRGILNQDRLNTVISEILAEVKMKHL